MPERRPLFKAVVTVISLSLAASAGFAGLTVARGGRAVARIVVAGNATETEKQAAAELALFLHIVTGGDFPVATAAGTAGAGGRLLVGEGAARLADPSFAAAALGPEEVVVRSAGDDLILAGGSPRGTLYAVMAFLEDAVGCRWWTPAASRMPWRPTLEVGPLAVRFSPLLEYREPFWYVAFDDAWAARNKANGIRSGGSDLYGGRQLYEGFVHTFYPLIPPEKYFKDHPEWFSEVNGKRTTEDAQLCLTNEEMRRELVRNLEERLRRNPKATIASVSQNDCFNPCQCPKCRAVEAEEGSPSGPLLRFVNAVAADIEKDFPGVAIDTLAYQYTRKPPRLARPRPNVIVRLCSIECSFSQPLDGERNKSFFEDLAGWSAIAGRLYVWDYTTDFAHYVQPHPNYAVLGPNIRLLAAHKVRGLFEQGAYQSWGSEMAELRAWMLAKLLWDPGRDPGKLMDEFVRGYYGPAAGPVADYLGLLERAVRASGDHLGCYSPPEAKFLSLETLTRAWSLLGKAGRRVAGTVEYARRVRRVRMPVAYVVLARWDALRKEAADRRMAWPWPDRREDLLGWFLDAARTEGVTMISEGQTLEDWAALGGRNR
ncbi:MAG TPA: DUF4838 domain-containing protein [Terriglobales bacterium]|nr:DUF4838 domain-containing protein [Terriglobales bacterium]